MKPVGTVASSPVGTSIKVEPRAAIDRLRPGMDLCFTAPTGLKRIGTATVERVDIEAGEVHFTSRLNCSIVSIAEGDTIHEYEIPCTRCQCRRCALAELFG